MIPGAKTSGNFDAAALAGFRVERSRVSAQGEFLCAGMSGAIDLPRFRLNLDTISLKLLGGFEVAPALYVDAGVRYYALKMTASVLDFPEETWKPSIWEPVIGVTFRPQLSSSVRIMAQADFGGIGTESHRTAAAKAQVEWKPLAHLSIGVGYGFLYLRADGTLRDQADSPQPDPARSSHDDRHRVLTAATARSAAGRRSDVPHSCRPARR